MNLSTYSCNTEGLYFLDFLSYPKIRPEFQRHRFSQLPETSYDSFELNAHDWLVVVEFRKDSKIIFYMGLVDLLRQKGFEIPFHNWGYEVGVKL